MSDLKARFEKAAEDVLEHTERFIVRMMSEVKWGTGRAVLS